MIKLWCEGFQVQEGTSGAWRLGTYPVDTLLEAAKMYKASIEDPSLVDLDKMTYWGCRLLTTRKMPKNYLDDSYDTHRNRNTSTSWASSQSTRSRRCYAIT